MAKADLKPVRSKDEAKSRGRKGGIASGKARREKRSLREALETLLSMPCDTEKDKTNLQAVAASLIKKALTGDVTAFTALRDSIGEKPTDKTDKNVNGKITISWQK